MRKSIMLSCILALTLGMASQAFAVEEIQAQPVTAKLKCDAQLKLSDAQICAAGGCLDVVEELNEVLETNHKQIQQFKLDCAQAISATVAVAERYCGSIIRAYGGWGNIWGYGSLFWLVPPSTVSSASGEIVNMTALCGEDNQNAID